MCAMGLAHHAHLTSTHPTPFCTPLLSVCCTLLAPPYSLAQTRTHIAHTHPHFLHTCHTTPYYNSCLEIFTGSGEVLSTRIYRGASPHGHTDAGIEFVALDGEATLERVAAYDMASIWLPSTAAAAAAAAASVEEAAQTAAAAAAAEGLDLEGLDFSQLNLNDLLSNATLQVGMMV